MHGAAANFEWQSFNVGCMTAEHQRLAARAVGPYERMGFGRITSPTALAAQDLPLDKHREELQAGGLLPRRPACHKDPDCVVNPRHPLSIADHPVGDHDGDVPAIHGG